jgi:hypothetical protein
MASYTEYKSKRFNLRKDASDWAKKEKSRVEGVMVMKIDINYKPSEPMPWEAVLLIKE